MFQSAAQESVLLGGCGIALSSSLLSKDSDWPVAKSAARARCAFRCCQCSSKTGARAMATAGADEAVLLVAAAAGCCRALVPASDLENAFAPDKTLCARARSLFTFESGSGVRDGACVSALGSGLGRRGCRPSALSNVLAEGGVARRAFSASVVSSRL